VAIVTPSSTRTGVVLSGGGARGAYEAGVIAGIVDILGGQRRERAPFSIFTGTSVGAINATWLAAHADRPDMNVSGLLERWRSLELREHLRISPMRFLWPSRSGERHLLNEPGERKAGFAKARNVGAHIGGDWEARRQGFRDAAAFFREHLAH